MSRRHKGSLTRGRATTPADFTSRTDGPEPAEPYWYNEPIPTHPEYLWRDWQEAFADTTLSVCETTWRKQGARMYSVHRDPLLREDLQDWLWVEAQNLANDYTPHPDSEHPERYWAAYLTRGLRARARWHFGQVIGDKSNGPAGAAAAAAYSTTQSVEHLQQREAEEGIRVRSRPLHGHDIFATNPEDILIHIETFIGDLRDAHTRRRLNGTYTSTTSDTCIINLCTKPAKHRGMCKTHYERERKLTGKTCTIPSCARPYAGRGLCNTHLRDHNKGKLDPALHQYVQAKKTTPTTCTIPGCGNPHLSKGMCSSHYMKARRERAS